MRCTIGYCDASGIETWSRKLHATRQRMPGRSPISTQSWKPLDWSAFPGMTNHEARGCLSRQPASTVWFRAASFFCCAPSLKQALQGAARANRRVAVLAHRALGVEAAAGDLFHALAGEVVAVLRHRAEHRAHSAGVVREADALPANLVTTKHSALCVDVAGATDEVRRARVGRQGQRHVRVGTAEDQQAEDERGDPRHEWRRLSPVPTGVQRADQARDARRRRATRTPPSVTKA